jgi:hypothetical protein
VPKEPIWKAERLAVADVRQHPDFQIRVEGIDRRHVKRLAGQLKAGETLPAIEVARIGRALYALDGFHRLEAHKAEGIADIEAKVARMSLQEAKARAGLANLRHGKGPSRADKQAAFDRYVALGSHLVTEGEAGPLDTVGDVKSSRRIAAELGGLYSHVTIRNKLKALDIEISERVEYPHGYKPMDIASDDAMLESEREEEALEALRSFEALYQTLEDDTQRELLRAAREMIQALENGKRPERSERLPLEAVLDI